MQVSCYWNVQVLGFVGGKLLSLPENSTSDTPSSHKFVAEFVQFLLKGAPMTVVDAPHTYLHQFLRSQAHFIPQDDMELVADKGTDRCGFWIESNHEQDVRERNFNESEFLC